MRNLLAINKKPRRSGASTKYGVQPTKPLPVPPRSSGTGTTDSAFRHCTRRAHYDTAQTLHHATSSNHAGHSGYQPAGRHHFVRSQGHIARAAFGTRPRFLLPMPARKKAFLLRLLRPGFSTASFSSLPPFYQSPACWQALHLPKLNEQFVDIDYSISYHANFGGATGMLNEGGKKKAAPKSRPLPAKELTSTGRQRRQSLSSGSGTGGR